MNVNPGLARHGMALYRETIGEVLLYSVACGADQS